MQEALRVAQRECAGGKECVRAKRCARRRGERRREWSIACACSPPVCATAALRGVAEDDVDEDANRNAEAFVEPPHK